MKKRIFALAGACALAMVLAACDGGSAPLPGPAPAIPKERPFHIPSDLR